MAAFRSSCALGRATGAHRHDQQLVDAGGPVHRIGRRGGHLERQEGGVVVGCHAAVDKDEGVGIGRAFGKGHHLGREEGRCRRAGAHQLPQRQTQVVVLARDLVVFGEGVVTDGPGGVGAGIAHHHHQQGTKARAAQRSLCRPPRLAHCPPHVPPQTVQTARIGGEGGQSICYASGRKSLLRHGARL